MLTNAAYPYQRPDPRGMPGRPCRVTAENDGKTTLTTRSLYTPQSPAPPRSATVGSGGKITLTIRSLYTPLSLAPPRSAIVEHGGRTTLTTQSSLTPQSPFPPMVPANHAPQSLHLLFVSQKHLQHLLLWKRWLQEPRWLHLMCSTPLDHLVHLSVCQHLSAAACKNIQMLDALTRMRQSEMSLLPARGAKTRLLSLTV